MTDRERPRRRATTSGAQRYRPTRSADEPSTDPVIDNGDAEPVDSDPTVPSGAKRPVRPGRRGSVGRVLGRLTTRRAALLALVVCALALSVAVPLHTYLAQRDDLRSQQRQQQDLRAQESELLRQQAQLADPAQVQAQARTRLRYVLPGETPYVVQLPNTAPDAGSSAPGRPAGQTGGWYDVLWNSITR
jgi:cell division protein FtsB